MHGCSGVAIIVILCCLVLLLQLPLLLQFVLLMVCPFCMRACVRASVCVCMCVCMCVCCACVKVQEVQSSRSPPPTSTTEQKTRPPPLHTRYPLVSTSIEDLFYRSLVQTRSRTRSMRGQHYFRLIYGSGRFYGPACSRATRWTDTPRRLIDSRP